MIDISAWMNEFLEALNSEFENNIWFVGLQGSYGRGEATNQSDIDVVVIFDKLNAEDIKKYNTMLDKLPHRELICGFVSGKDELLLWEASDLLQFYYDTTPIIGSLDCLLPLLDENVKERAIKIGACNIYHGCAHNMLHEKSDDILRALYKSASFVAQAVALRDNGKYYKSQSDLLEAATDREKVIIQTFLSLKAGEKVDFEKMSESLFVWAQELIKK